MNDPKEIIINISIDEDETQENKDNNLLLNLKESLSKRFYKKTIMEIDSLIQGKHIEGHSRSWKIYIYKIRAILGVIKNKIMKYLINHTEKIRIKHQINMIKKYFNKIPIEFDNFFIKNQNIPPINNIELTNDLLTCYLEYIYLISYFNKNLGNTIDCISYLSFVLRLYKETRLIPKTKVTNNKFLMCFLFLINLYISNEDYYNAINYLNISMDMCFQNLIYYTKDVNDGVFKFDKNNINKIDIYNESTWNYINKIKRIILNIGFIFFNRGICYESLGKIINAIKCNIQILWFFEHFYINSFKYLYYLNKTVLEKRIDFKNSLDIINKKIKLYENRTKNKKDEHALRKGDANDKKNSKSLFSRKFKGLVNKLEKLKIPEIDLVNKFEEKKNLRRYDSQQKIEGKDKNIFLYGVRLFNTYLREDFRPIINDMKKIKSFALDYHTQEKIQKFVRKLYFNQNQRKIKLQLEKERKKSLNLSLPDFTMFNKGKTIKIKKNILLKRPMSTKNINDNLINYKTSFISNSTKNQKYRTLEKNLSFEPILEKPSKIPKYKIIKLTSICDGREVYKEDEKLNKFFNKKYLAKRSYIKKLESRELDFQKYILRVKNTSKIPFEPFNREIFSRKVIAKYDKLRALSVSSTPFYKENISQEDYRRTKVFNRLESIAISSLNNSAFVKFKEEEKKQKKMKFFTFDKITVPKFLNNSDNKSMIEKFNLNLEEIEQRQEIEIKNFKKLVNENNKYIKHRNERNSSYLLRKEKETDDSEEF